MDVTVASRLIRLTKCAADALGPDATLRQLSSFLVIAAAGEGGTESAVIVARTESSQSTASRNIKLLYSGGLVDMSLDHNDTRRRILTVTKKGSALLARMGNAMAA